MSSVDFYADPPRAELGEELQQAFRELNLEGLEERAPGDDDALLGVRFPDSLSADELQAQAEDLRIALAALLTGGPSVTFEVTGS